MKTRVLSFLLVVLMLAFTLVSCDGPEKGNGGDKQNIFNVDISSFKNSEDESVRAVFESVNSVKLVNESEYVIEVSARGYKDGLVIRVTIGQDGRISDVKTVSHNETLGGEQLGDGKYNASFIEKNHAEAEAVDIVAGSTMTTKGFKNAIRIAFEAFEIITK
jgi:uncharacterized protein with FMN-binding domain